MRALPLPLLLVLLLCACRGGEPQSSVLPNRDLHGPEQVGEYIERLASPERVAELQVDLVLEKLALPDDAAVGDLGCGPGVFAIPLAQRLPHGVVFASDVEPRQLDCLRERLHENGLANVVPVLASYDDPHFPPRALDLVLIVDTLHHIEDRERYLSRLRDVLRPDGRLAVLEYKPGALPVGPPADHKLVAGELERTLRAAGFERSETFATHAYHDFEVWRVKRGDD
jgi:SAM-dependent methyltransferase